MSGGSHTGAVGAVHNPHKMGYSAGGSSSGCGVVVALGEVDMAIGGDQGGSIRMPSSFCGTYGMKPTWGLVPYTGIMPIEVFVDHTGPMTATVADNALLLEVLAGDDGYDPRIKAPKVEDYTKALGQGVKGMKIGILKEGFEQAERGGRRQRKRPRGRQALQGSRRHGRDRLDPDASGRSRDLDADRHRGHDPDHDVWRRLWPQPLRPLFDLADGFPSRLAPAGGSRCRRPQSCS